MHQNTGLTQQRLPLDGEPADCALREAYDATKLEKFGVTYDTALASPSTRLSLTRLAEAMHKARRAR